MAREKGVREFVLSWLYDTAVMAAGVTQTQWQFFGVGIGQTMPGTVPPMQKTYRHTNMETGGFLGGIKNFTISAMVLVIQPFMNSNDVNNLLNGYGTLLINSKPYPSPFPINLMCGGGNWRESVRGPAAAPDFRAFPGDGRLDNIIPAAKPFQTTIDTLESFRVALNWEPPGFTPEEDLMVEMRFFGRAGREVS